MHHTSQDCLHFAGTWGKTKQNDTKQNEQGRKQASKRAREGASNAMIAMQQQQTTND
jgi:hypothetical protein